MKKNEKFIWMYTRQSFFFNVINQALRRLTSPLDSFYIRQPFQDLFLAVLQLYKKQKKDKFRSTDFKCYRGSIISDEEFDNFSKNKGGYVEMEGFLSTSLEKEKAFKNYEHGKKNTMMEIRVSVNGLGGELDWGFAEITKISDFIVER